VRVVVLSGPDGSGKSTLISEAVRVLRDRNHNVGCYWIRWGRFLSIPLLVCARATETIARGRFNARDPTITLFDKLPPIAFVFLVLQYLDMRLSLAVTKARAAVLGVNVLLIDRFIPDMLVDIAVLTPGQDLLRHAVSSRIIDYLFRHTTPFVLDAPLDILRARRKDLAEDPDLEARTKLYRVLTAAYGLRVLDATRPLDQLTAALTQAVES